MQSTSVRTTLRGLWHRYWGFPVLAAWGAVYLGLGFASFEPYGIDEAAARALLLNWTVTGNVVSPIVTLGAPDFRALLFAPLGIYWSGSLIAVKVFTLGISFAAVVLLYRWSRATSDDEAALTASGLLLLAPLTLTEINALGVGPYLLLAYGVGAWLDRKYRRVQRQLGGWYFLELLLIVATVSLHPAGLAYPLALAWQWYQDPLDQRQQRQHWIGIGAAVVFALLFHFGWPTLSWLDNPLPALAQTLIGQIPGDTGRHYALGLLVCITAVCVLIADRKHIGNTLLGRMLLIGTLIGLAAPDRSWALLVLVILLYRGGVLLIGVNEKLGSRGFAGQRGLVMAMLVIVATVFMIGDKSYRVALLRGTLAPQDELIQKLSEDVRSSQSELRIASQWPARTMLATRHAAFPLPPRGLAPDSLRDALAALDYIVFDPEDPRNQVLAHAIASEPELTETLAVGPGGIVLRVRTPAGKPG